MTQRFVLIFEDDPTLGKITATAMQQLGYQTQLDPDGDQYPRWLAAETLPDLILLDLHMPMVSGKEILRELRREPRLAAIPVIIMTADIQYALKFEAQGERVLIKPVSVSRLQATVQELLG